MISAPTENERKVKGMADHIKQKIESGKKSICDFCFHQKVCKGIGNQPCTECSHYQDAADVAPVRHGRWDNIPNTYMCVAGKDGSYHGNATSCSVCNEINPNAYKTNYCPNCGAKMDLEV